MANYECKLILCVIPKVENAIGGMNKYRIHQNKLQNRGKVGCYILEAIQVRECSFIVGDGDGSKFGGLRKLLEVWRGCKKKIAPQDGGL